MTEQQTLEKIERALQSLQSEMMALRLDLKHLEQRNAETTGKIEAAIENSLYALSQKLDEQPWHAVYALNEKIDGQPWHAVYALNEKIDALLKATSLTEGVYKHVSDEADRLDGYLNYHVAQLKKTIQRPTEGTREIDKT